MKTLFFKIYGAEGHRQRQSFGRSDYFDFSQGDKIRKIEILREDMTRTNDYVGVVITCNTEEECYAELNGQLSDGIFENSRYGKIEQI